MNTDRPLTIVRQWAAAAALTAGTTTDFFWTQMNYRALVAYVREALRPGARCVCCGQDFDEQSIHLEHYELPRHPQDWARPHARNLWVACGSCTRAATAAPFAVWLDAQKLAEDATH